MSQETKSRRVGIFQEANQEPGKIKRVLNAKRIKRKETSCH